MKKIFVFLLVLVLMMGFVTMAFASTGPTYKETESVKVECTNHEVGVNFVMKIGDKSGDELVIKKNKAPYEDIWFDEEKAVKYTEKDILVTCTMEVASQDYKKYKAAKNFALVEGTNELEFEIDLSNPVEVEASPSPDKSNGADECFVNKKTTFKVTIVIPKKETPTPTDSATATTEPTDSPTETAIETPTNTPTNTPTESATSEPTPTETVTETITIEPTNTSTPTSNGGSELPKTGEGADYSILGLIVIGVGIVIKKLF